MRRIPIGVAQCKHHAIHYYILAEASEQGIESYGALIEYCGESVAVRNITLSQQRIMNLSNKLKRGRVTPSTLIDVINDWLLQ